MQQLTTEDMVYLPSLLLRKWLSGGVWVLCYLHELNTDRG